MRIGSLTQAFVGLHLLLLPLANAGEEPELDLSQEFDHGASVSLYARSFSHTECRYFSTTGADIHWTVKIPNAEWGDRVFVSVSYYDDFMKTWSLFEMYEASSVAPFTWRAEVNGVTVASRGRFSISKLRAQIQYHRQGVLWPLLINGGEVYLESVVPQMTCEKKDLMPQSLVPIVPFLEENDDLSLE